MLSAKQLAAYAVLSISVVAAPAVAQDYGPYGYGSGVSSPGLFDWDGFYAGVYGGGVPMGTQSWNTGVFAGVNVGFESAVFGVEAQFGADFANTTSMDALVLGKGGVVFGQALVYGTGGAGLVSGDVGYAFGGGVDYGLTDYMSIRGEALGTGSWGAMPEDLRLTAGVAFHL